MMRGIRRLVVIYGALAGLLAAGAVTASMEVAAHADTTLTGCFATASNNYDCTMQGNVTNPATISVNITDGTAADNVTVNWAVDCSEGNDTAGSPAAMSTPVTLALTLPAGTLGTCNVQATVDISPPFTTANYANCIKPGSTPTSSSPSTSTASPSPPPPTCATEFDAQISYTTAGSSTSAPAVTPVKGYRGMCVDDKRNSSSNGAAVIIWSCSSSDQAQSWKFSSSELQHNGKCVNDKGDGGSRSKLIMYNCDGGANEVWTQMANGELRLQAHNGTLCMDDPRSSTSNGTQLIVYSCNDGANQKWSLP